MTFRPFLAAVALATLSAGALAHPAYRGDATHTPRIDARQAQQAARIRQGLASGALTAHEAVRLQAGQQRIARVTYRAGADGIVTGAERRHLTRLQDRASRQIARQKHDRQHAWR